MGRGEVGHAVQHRLGGLDDLFLVAGLVVVRPGDADHPQEGHQRLFRREQNSLIISLPENVRSERLGQLQGTVVGNEHHHVVQRLIAFPDVILVAFAGQGFDLGADGSEVADGGLGLQRFRLGGHPVGVGVQGHFRVDDDFRLVGVVQDEVGTHPLAAVLVQDDDAHGIPERLFLVEITPFRHPFIDQHVVQDGLAPAARHLVLALERRSEVVGLLADIAGLRRQVPDGPFQLFLQGGRRFRMALFLRVEGILHLLQILVQAAGNGLEGLFGLAGEFLFPLLEQALRFRRHLRPDGSDLLLQRRVMRLLQERD